MTPAVSKRATRPETGPLAGLRVLDLTRGRAGGLAAMLLSDYGADVLRIEPPGGDPLWDELSGYPVWHRGKQVIELDLRAARAQAALRGRLGVADVLLESFAPGTMARFGLAYADVAASAPRLIYASISGYGQVGADRDRPGYDALVQARSGVAHFQGAGRGRPVPCMLPWPSLGGGLLAVIGVLAALQVRRWSGRGQLVDTSLLDGVLAQSTMFVLAVDRPTAAFAGPGRLSGTAPTMAVYECGDGGHLQIHTGQRGAFERLVRATGLDASEFVAQSDARHFRGDPTGAARFQHALGEALRSRTRDEWVETLAGADVAAAPCLAPGDALRHAQTRAIGMAVELNDPVLGVVTQVGLPIRFAATPGEVRGPAVRRGFTPNPEAALRHAGWPTVDEVGARAAPGTPEPPEPPEGARRALRTDSISDLGVAPLDGLRVLDFGMFAAGPYAATLLADLGAEVVKIEPLTGDTMRPAARNFVGLHRGKRGLALDLKAGGAKEIVDRLVRQADVVVHNLRPGVAERLQIGWERLRAINDRLVYCHSSAYGTSGPLAGLPGFDQVYQAFCGLEVMQGGEGQKPEQVGGAPIDYANALLSAVAVLMALRWREETGAGQHVECPQLAAGLLAVSDVYVTADGPSGVLRITSDQSGDAPTHRLYRAADARWVAVCCPDEESRSRFWAAVGATPEVFIGARPACEVHALLCAAEVPCEIAREFLVDALVDDESLLATGRIVSSEHPALGRVRQPGGFIRLSSCGRGGNRAAPRLGEHTREILGEIGYAAGEIDRLHAEGVVGWPLDDQPPGH
jgi:crotonobetainyl-CoA:carnitine CoA-transferase CaiB-like acyl-CoA transferase